MTISIHTIPVSPLTENYDCQYLSVEKHDFPVVQSHGKIVFLISHANGFHKEVYRPMIQRLSMRLSAKLQHLDLSFVAWDARFHGDSARLNKDQYNPRYRWMDNALDTKQVIDVLELNRSKLIGIGHSFGATSMILLESFYPHTFDGLCLIEPVLSNTFLPTEIRLKAPIYSSIRRRDEWPDREVCLNSLLERPFWKKFDKEALENYVNYGMYDTEKGTIRLKCTKEHEYHMFMCTSMESFTAFNFLQTLQTPTHCVFGYQSSLKNIEMTNAIVNPKTVVEYVEGSHMIPCELPDNIVPQVIKLIQRLNDAKSSSKL